MYTDCRIKRCSAPPLTDLRHHMTSPTPLTVRGPHGLVLNMGIHEVRGDDLVRITAPVETAYQQVIRHLEALPGVGIGRYGAREEALAAVAICIRWGSYLALLGDSERPLPAGARVTQSGQIANAEMMRLNIEMSAALANWLQRMDDSHERYWTLVHKANHYLPMESRSYTREPSTTSTVAGVAKAPQLMEMVHQSTPARHTQVALAHPHRVVANTVINTAWRNGPIEAVHSGTSGCEFSPDERRIALRDMQAVLRSANGILGDILWAVSSRRFNNIPWTDFALPFADPVSWGGTTFRGVAPFEWTVDLDTCDIEFRHSPKTLRTDSTASG